ncbi:Hypothetical predicted protein [Mytilus galloprovincialis]|uniref:CCHC-type domain-containing protein n=1 Tax=Mytilus galloprovincialis TaxID=29158 RepID=A0A8B6GYQ1_MYTGA|nr:Hypothetical predicted protein [Mytilus galloprovincialis]
MLLDKEISEFSAEMYLELIMMYNNDIHYDELNSFKEKEDLRTLSVLKLKNRLEKSLSVSNCKVEKMLKKELECSDLIRLCHIGIELANAKSSIVVMIAPSKKISGEPTHTCDNCASGEMSFREEELNDRILELDSLLQTGSVDSLIGQLRAIFRDHGRGTDWNDMLGLGNPAASSIIKKYLSAIKLEQSMAAASPKHAVPLFSNKLILVSRYISYKMSNKKLAIFQKYILIRDKTFFNILSFTGDRAGDLGSVLTDQVRWLPGEEGVIISMMKGKTIDISDPRVVIIYNSVNTEFCPVTVLREYIDFCKTTQLKAEIELLKKGINVDVIEQALREVKEYAARSREINVDTLQLKLMHLDEVARRVGHQDRELYSMVLQRFLCHKNHERVGFLVTSLLSSPAETKLFEKEQKFLKIHGNELLSTKQQKDEVETKNFGNENQFQQFATMMQCMQSVLNPRPSTPFMAQRFAQNPRRMPGNGQRKPPSNYTGCFKCGDINHFKIDCPK